MNILNFDFNHADIFSEHRVKNWNNKAMLVFRHRFSDLWTEKAIFNKPKMIYVNGYIDGEMRIKCAAPVGLSHGWLRLKN